MALLLGLGLPEGVLAAGTVTNCQEAALRDAIAGGGTVTFSCDGTITLSGPVVISNTTSLESSGHNVTISGAGVTQLFLILPGVTLTLQNLTLSDGLALGTNGAPGAGNQNGQNGGPGQGGAVFNNGGTLWATNCGFLRNKALGGTGGTVSGNSFSNPGNGGVGQGGTIYNCNGQVTATNCLFQGNASLGGAGAPTSGDKVSFGGDSAGGAIFNTGGGVLLTGCMVSGNRSVSGDGTRFGSPVSKSGLASGGAIEISGGALMLAGSILSNNSCQVKYAGGARGGAITQNGGTLGVNDTIFNGNWVAGGEGPGIATLTGLPGGPAFGGGLCLLSGTAGMTNSTFANNHVKGGLNEIGNFPGAGAGGGVYSLGSLSLLNCTVAGNAAQAGDNTPTGIQGGAYGGGLYNNSGTMTLAHATLANNAAVPDATNGSTHSTIAVAQGGGLYSTNGVATLLNTIVANSVSGSNCWGPLTDLGHNLSSDASCQFSAEGSLNNTDPKLGPLDSYGGPTPTMALLAGSPAIDGGDNTSFAPTDQRGHARPFGPAPDIGAFESSPPYSIRGVVAGSTLKDEVPVTTGAISATTAGGHYSLDGLSTSTYSVSLQSANYLFVPPNRSVTVGPDQLGVNFKAYHWNALSLDDATNGILHLVFAATNGQTYRLLASTDLVQWSSQSTNTSGPNNYWEIFISMTGTKQFFRTVIP